MILKFIFIFRPFSFADIEVLNSNAMPERSYCNTHDDLEYHDHNEQFFCDDVGGIEEREYVSERRMEQR